VKPVSIVFLKPVHILLREIEFLKIQVLEVVFEKLATQLLVVIQPRKMAVLKHDRHLATYLVKIRLLPTDWTRKTH
jgi:hypothetical protein